MYRMQYNCTSLQNWCNCLKNISPLFEDKMENYYRTEIEYSAIVAMNKGMDQYLTVMFVTHPKSKVSQYIYWTSRERIQNLLTDKFDKFYKLFKKYKISRHFLFRSRKSNRNRVLQYCGSSPLEPMSQFCFLPVFLSQSFPISLSLSFSIFFFHYLCHYTLYVFSQSYTKGCLLSAGA